MADFFSDLFSGKKIPLDNIASVHDDSPNLIVYSIPFMFFFVILEYFISKKQHKGYYDNKETIGSTLVGLGNVGIGVLLKTILLGVFVVIYNLVPWKMTFNWWTFLPCYIIFDFCSYWAHRISHHTRFFWATHVTHHSGENYNLTVSFRLSWVQYFKIIFFMPVALFGFHPVIIFITNQVAILFQFWVHTEYIRKTHPIIEYLFATPSNHRVHHGSQEQYINRNFGATFIIWDRMFGTYQPEVENVKYGITHELESKADPFYLNFHEYFDIVRDFRQARGLKEKLFMIFGDPVDIARYKESKLVEEVIPQKNSPLKEAV
jgi:sterol desaturase/sphingolipid hydroxylase (fatty acid hydroxylase superfamily)